MSDSANMKLNFLISGLWFFAAIIGITGLIAGSGWWNCLLVIVDSSLGGYYLGKALRGRHDEQKQRYRKEQDGR